MKQGSDFQKGNFSSFYSIVAFLTLELSGPLTDSQDWEGRPTLQDLWALEHLMARMEGGGQTNPTLGPLIISRPSSIESSNGNKSCGLGVGVGAKLTLHVTLPRVLWWMDSSAHSQCNFPQKIPQLSHWRIWTDSSELSLSNQQMQIARSWSQLVTVQDCDITHACILLDSCSLD